MLSVNEVAARWSVDPKFVYALIASGDLSALKLGASGTKRPMIRVPLQTLEEYEKNQLNGSAT